LAVNWFDALLGPAAMATTIPPDTPISRAGVLALNEFYTIKEAQSRLGWSDAALRAAKRRGLKLLRSGKRRYITGQEILRFLMKESDAE